MDLQSASPAIYSYGLEWSVASVMELLKGDDTKKQRTSVIGCKRSKARERTRTKGARGGKEELGSREGNGKQKRKEQIYQ